MCTPHYSGLWTLFLGPVRSKYPFEIEHFFEYTIPFPLSQSCISICALVWLVWRVSWKDKKIDGEYHWAKYRRNRVARSSELLRKAPNYYSFFRTLSEFLNSSEYGSFSESWYFPNIHCIVVFSIIVINYYCTIFLFL
jgi:hypothetical protein